MEHTSAASIHHEHHVGGGRKEIWRVTIILSVLTIVELGLGFLIMDMEEGFLKHFIKGVIVILMLAKAFYIVGYFMHLKHEIRNLIMTIVVPVLSFIWFILAFLLDGNSYRVQKNAFDPYHEERSKQKMEQPAHNEGEERNPHEKPEME